MSQQAKVALAWAQGGFYVATGLWPIVHIRSFEAVTGPKTDRWLVKTVAGLITVVGVTLLDAARRGEVSRDAVLVATGSAAALTAIDLVYVPKKRISPIYLLDAVAELGLIALWAAAERKA